jgi:coenzyme F420 hydrogenase subunit beta
MSRKYNISDIVNQDLCTGCGICVSESKETLKIGWNEFGFLVPQQIGNNINNEAIRVCPFNPNPDEEVKDEDKLGYIFLSDAAKYDLKIGRFENTYIGFANEYRETSSSGGIATFVFKKLLEDKIVENLYVVKEVNGTYEYQLFNSIKDIIKISKTRYIPVTLEELFNKIELIEGRVAVSGVACFIKAIRLKQYYNPELKEKIPFLIGIICGGLKSKFFTDYLAQESGIILKYSKQEYRIKNAKSESSDYSFGAYDDNNDFHQIKMSKVGDMWGTGLFKSNACDFCTDVLTELADISLGDAWLDEYRKDGLGNSVIVTRTKLADQLIIAGITNLELQVNNIDSYKIIQSQSSSFSHRWDGLKTRLLRRRFQGKVSPKIRDRVIKNATFPYIMVQLFRQNTRRKSVVFWKDNPYNQIFKQKMKTTLYKLNILTKIYHKLRLFKK